MVEYLEENIDGIYKKDQEKRIAYAVLEIFRKSDVIENFNKKALYLFIREMTNCKTQHITKVVNKMKDIQSNLYARYLERGTLSND